MRKEAWRRRFAMEDTFVTVKPNAGHVAIAELVSKGRVSHVIAQNIDNLHRDSGVPVGQVIELRGNTRYAKSLGCDNRTDLEPVRAYFEAKGTPPDCSANNLCSGTFAYAAFRSKIGLV
jgi:NAD-dependent deacetylase